MKIQHKFSCCVLAMRPRVNSVCQRTLCVFLPCECESAVCCCLFLCAMMKEQNTITYQIWSDSRFLSMTAIKVLTCSQVPQMHKQEKLACRSHLPACPQRSVHIVRAFFYIFCFSIRVCFIVVLYELVNSIIFLYLAWTLDRDATCSPLAVISF